MTQRAASSFDAPPARRPGVGRRMGARAMLGVGALILLVLASAGLELSTMARLSDAVANLHAARSLWAQARVVDHALAEMRLAARDLSPAGGRITAALGEVSLTELAATRDLARAHAFVAAPPATLLDSMGAAVRAFLQSHADAVALEGRRDDLVTDAASAASAASAKLWALEAAAGVFGEGEAAERAARLERRLFETQREALPTLSTLAAPSPGLILALRALRAEAAALVDTLARPELRALAAQAADDTERCARALEALGQVASARDRDYRVDSITAAMQMQTTELEQISGVAERNAAAEVAALVDGARLRIMVQGGLFAIISLLVGWSIARMAVGPMTRLTAGAIDLAHGRDVVLPDEGRADEAGELAQALRVFQRAMGALAEEKEGAERLARIKAEFLAIMSHEVRTPLNGVIGVARMMLEDELPAAQRERATLMLQSAQSLLALVNDALDLSRLDAGKMTALDQPFDLDRLCEDVAALSAARAREKGVELRLDRADGAPRWISGDAGRLRQVLLNLLSNAVKFTETGWIALRVKTPDPTPDASGRALLWFEVEDTGVGVPADAAPHLFEPFALADGSAARRYSGAGLGLAICRRLVALMGGGAIEVESEEGRGALFRFCIRAHLLRAAPTPTDLTPPPSQDAAQPLGMDVLLAEDDEVSRMVARSLLERLGCVVTAVADGAAAAEHAALRRFDAIVMDMRMPGMDGLEATRRIRAGGASADAPIIGLTANADEAEQAACRAAGMTDVLAKPADGSTLADALARRRRAVVFDAASAAASADAAPLDPPPPQETPTLEWGRWRELERSLGRGRLRAMAAKWRVNAAAGLDRLAAATDAESLEREAHTLAGGARMLGLAAFGSTAAAVMDAARQEAPVDVAAAVERLRLRLAQAEHALEDALSAPDPAAAPTDPPTTPTHGPS